MNDELGSRCKTTSIQAFYYYHYHYYFLQMQGL